MAKVTPITLYALANEKCWAYIELQEQAPDFSGFHRYRLIYVNRDGNITEFREDLGQAKNFIGAKAAIHIPSVWQHTVDELRNLADELRWETDLDIKDFLELDDYKKV